MLQHKSFFEQFGFKSRVNGETKFRAAIQKIKNVVEPTVRTYIYQEYLEDDFQASTRGLSELRDLIHTSTFFCYTVLRYQHTGRVLGRYGTRDYSQKHSKTESWSEVKNVDQKKKNGWSDYSYISWNNFTHENSFLRIDCER